MSLRLNKGWLVYVVCIKVNLAKGFGCLMDSLVAMDATLPGISIATTLRSGSILFFIPFFHFIITDTGNRFFILKTEFNMKLPVTNLLLISAFLSIFFSCQNDAEQKSIGVSDKAADTPNRSMVPIRDNVLTADEQKALTPDSIIEALKEGNRRFVSNDLTLRDHSAMVRKAATGQYPKAVILSCIDSRVPVEDVFNEGIGDLFVIRIAGNIVNEDILGSMEFGCKVSGAKLIVVLGHEACGAIKSAIDNVKLGNITAMLENVKPAVIKAQDYSGDKKSSNADFVEYVAKKNVLNTVETIRKKSPILKEMEDKGEIKIVGAYYNLKTGEVIFL